MGKNLGQCTTFEESWAVAGMRACLTTKSIERCVRRFSLDCCRTKGALSTISRQVQPPVPPSGNMERKTSDMVSKAASGRECATIRTVTKENNRMQDVDTSLV